MGDRRMFAKTIVDSDAFLDMPLSTQALYFHLGMRADDEGFVNNPKRIQRLIGASDDDLRILAAKRYILVFESGVIVIKHWKVHNYIQNDRFRPTAYTEERALIEEKENKSYTFKKFAESFSETPLDTVCIQSGYSLDTQVNKDKLSKVKEVNKDKNIPPSGDGDVLSLEDSRFMTFWESYPKKLDKKNAHKAFLKVCKTDTQFQAILNGLEKWNAYWLNTDPQYIPYPSTWLNAERWNEEPPVRKSKSPFANVPFPEVMV